MLLFEVKDIVREHLGRTAFPSFLLDKALEQGRMIVEQQGNFYWMRAEAFWRTVINQQHYPIFSGDGPAPQVKITAFSAGNSSTPSTFNVQSVPIPRFKDVRFIFVKAESDTSWSSVQTGEITKEEIELNFSITETGMPAVIILDNFNLVVFPPMPDKEYVVKMFYYQWTENPKSNLFTDELLTRFPYAVIYGALAWAFEMELKDLQGAQYWRVLLGGQPGENGELGRGGEIARIRNHNFKRESQDKLSLTPLTGPYQRVRGLRTSQNIWLR